MAEFVMKEAHRDPHIIEFDVSIDDDGDFAVAANGVGLFFISHETGTLSFFGIYENDLSDLEAAGLSFKDNQLALSDDED
jgi:hypothetical protein